MKRILSLIFVSSLLLAPVFVSADAFGDCMTQTGGSFSECQHLQTSGGSNNETGGTEITTVSDGEITLNNPLKDDTIAGLIERVSGFIFGIGIAVAVIIIVLAGFNFVTSQGEPAKIEKAKNMILYTLIGVAVMILARGLIAIIRSVIER
jgi:hypothetical protein